MNAHAAALPDLRRLIGQSVMHKGICCHVLEVLEDGPALVLVDRQDTAIQDNQYGEPNRVVPRTYTVPVRAGVALHPDFIELTLARCN